VIHCPPDLDRVPAEVQPLVRRCLAKDSGLRPTVREVLAATNAARSMAGGSHGPATRTFIRPQALGGPSTATTTMPVPVALPESGPMPVPGAPPESGWHAHLAARDRGQKQVGTHGCSRAGAHRPACRRLHPAGQHGPTVPAACRSADDAISDAHRDPAAWRGADFQRGTDPDLSRVLSGRLSA
jgi:serine/threonine kinase PknH